MGLEKFGKCLSMAAWMSLLVVYAYAEGSSRKWRNEVLKQVNSKGPYIGLITVFPPEETAFFGTGAFKPSPIHSSLDLSGRRFRIGKVHDKKVIYVRCGVGMNQNGTLDSNDTVAHLDFETYNVPKGGHNILGQIRYIHEEFFSVSGEPNIARPLFWLEVNQEWLHVATKLERMELEQCINKSLCLPKKPKLVVGLRGTTANIFVDNAAYRDFLFHSFHVASTDMESAAVVMTSVSNGIPVIVIRGLSDKAGGQSGQNAIKTFGPLAARNAAKAVLQFLKQLN
ncbi:bark storage protein A isoform X2 [Ziziphus jujuba]|uniref:Bark storage protein A isoform X2 n=1 Tax=Ziziphus jujuba TaxID=326968 RepID=A0A6P3ZEW7_ZIZJJ|nr:bark storage protein A isoform X2 [Ziziphus jujuba]